MGVPRFVGSWVRSIPPQFGVLQKGFHAGQPNAGLGLDMNGIFHKAKNESTNEQECLDKITETIDLILSQVQPQRVFLLAVDGVAPLAKMSQQRQRRFRAALTPPDPTAPPPWMDPNSITPGTEFMFRLDAHLKAWLARRADTLPGLVIYSNHMEPGEGEHKILALLREERVQTALSAGADRGAFVIYGLDADLFMLMLVSPLIERGVPILLMREDVDDVASIIGLVRYIFSRIQRPDWAGKDVIDSFVFCMFLVGNDFLPHGPMFHDLGWVIEELLNGIRQGASPLIRNGAIQLPALAALVRGLAGFEKQTVYFEYERQQGGHGHRPIAHPDPLLDKAFAGSTRGRTPTDQAWNEYEGLWNMKIVHSARENPQFNQLVMRATREYVRGLAWTWAYYTQGTFAVSPTYMYPSYYSPTMHTLARFLRETPFRDVTALMATVHVRSSPNAFSPFRQLVSVLPAASRTLVPEPLRFLLTSDPAVSPIADLVPSAIEIDRDGTNADWQGIALVPFVDFDRVVDAVSGVLQKHPTLRDEPRWKTSTPVVITRTPARAGPGGRAGRGGRRNPT